MLHTVRRVLAHCRAARAAGPRFLYYDPPHAGRGRDGLGPYRLDSRGRSLSRGGEPVGLSPYEFDVLHLFVRCPNVVHSKDALIRAAWHDIAVGDNSLEKVGPADAAHQIGVANACAMRFEAHARHACRLDPDLAEAWATLGVVLERTGRRASLTQCPQVAGPQATSSVALTSARG